MISLGGSLVIPRSTDEIDAAFLTKFQKLLTSFKDRKFVIVVGGGSTARKYIKALGKTNVDKKSASLIGIGITRLNAKFLAYFFGSKYTAQKVPTTLQEVRKLLQKQKIVFTGALQYAIDQTSDGTAAQIANYLKTDFINITDVKGLYTKDPKKFRNAKLIPAINFADFDKLISKMTYKPGQHFILDQHASKIIKRHKIKTTIIGKDLNNFKRCLQDKSFTGTVIR